MNCPTLYAPIIQNNLQLLQQQALMAVSYSEFQIIISAWKPPLMDEFTSFGQKESAPAIFASTRESENCCEGL